MKYILPAAIAIGVGIAVLLGYLLPSPTLLAVRLVLTDWAVILGALAVLIGVINLLLVHARRIQSGDQGWVYSLVTILALLFTLAIGVYENFGTQTFSIYESGTISNILFQGVIVASLATLASLIMFLLVAAAARMPKTRPGGWTILFLAVVIVVLIGWLPFVFLAPVNSFRDWLLAVPVAAGARGILLGVALGTLVIGLRVLSGVERPYKD